MYIVLIVSSMYVGTQHVCYPSKFWYMVTIYIYICLFKYMCIYIHRQITIIPKPEFLNEGHLGEDSLTKPPFGVTSVQLAICIGMLNITAAVRPPA